MRFPTLWRVCEQLARWGQHTLGVQQAGLDVLTPISPGSLLGAFPAILPGHDREQNTQNCSLSGPRDPCWQIVDSPLIAPIRADALRIEGHINDVTQVM